MTIGVLIQAHKVIDKAIKDIPNFFELDNIELITMYPDVVCQIVQPFTDSDNIMALPQETVLGFMAIIQDYIEYEPTPIASFEFNDIEYHAPENIDFGNMVFPMGNITFGQAVEAFTFEQLLKGRYEYIPHVLATVFKGNAKDFHNLPIRTAMDAYFFLCSLGKKQTKTTLAHLTGNIDTPMTLQKTNGQEVANSKSTNITTG